jgi:hypothetical protein
MFGMNSAAEPVLIRVFKAIQSPIIEDIRGVWFLYSGFATLFQSNYEFSKFCGNTSGVPDKLLCILARTVKGSLTVVGAE